MRPILITGVPRSGTSLTAEIVSACGVFGGDVLGPTAENPHGFFENQQIRDQVVKPWLEALGADPAGQNPLPKLVQGFTIDACERLRNNVQGILREQGWDGGRWYYKCPKIALMPALWADAFPDAQWVIVRRNKGDVVNSLLNAKFMRAHTSATAWGLWVDRYLARLTTLKTRVKTSYEFWPGELLAGDHGSLEELITWLELDFRPELTHFADPTLWGRWS